MVPEEEPKGLKEGIGAGRGRECHIDNNGKQRRVPLSRPAAAPTVVHPSSFLTGTNLLYTTMPARSRRYLSLLAVLLVPLVQATPLSTHTYDVTRERSAFTLAPLIKDHHPHGSVNNSYIIVLKDDAAPHVVFNHMNFVQLAHQEHPSISENEFASGVRHIYDGHVKGYSGHFSKQFIDQIRELPEVDFIEQDQIVRTTDFDTQKGAPWVSGRYWSSDSVHC